MSAKQTRFNFDGSLIIESKSEVEGKTLVLEDFIFKKGDKVLLDGFEWEVRSGGRSYPSNLKLYFLVRISEDGNVVVTNVAEECLKKVKG